MPPSPPPPVTMPPATHQGTVTESQLHEIVVQHVASLNKPWPSDRDVLRAFKVFDSEGLGFIKVTLLKRFLVQAQLEVEDSVCECHCIHTPQLYTCVCI